MINSKNGFKRDSISNFGWLKCMVLIFMFGMLNVCHASADTQRNLLTLKVSNKSLGNVFSMIQKKTDYTFFYSSESLDVNRKVSIDVKNEKINNVLNKLLDENDNTYSVNGNKVYIKKAVKENRVAPQPAKRISSGHNMTGRVFDANTEEPLIGVTVQIKGSSNGTITDANGQFSLKVDNKSQLVFSYVGYKSQTKLVGDLGTLDIKMLPDNEQLGEVVIVGAGVQKKVSVTGAITSVKGSDLKVPSSSLTSAFAGKLSGVISMTHSGEPGSTSEFYIRGISTFGGRATPLILLDDVEISSGDLNNIPAESIESFSILKDASATAIYGARGANGVMLVTTKNGSENMKAKISLSVESSVQSSQNQISYVDGPTFMELYDEAQLSRNPTAIPKYSQDVIDNTRSGINPYVFPNVNWYDLIFKNSSYSQRANLNVQGGGSKVTYYMGLQANHDSGILRKIQANLLDTNVDKWKYVFQSNISYKLTPSTDITLRINTQLGNSDGPNVSTSDVFYQTWNATPVEFPAYYPAQDGDRHIRFGNAIREGKSLYTNPYAYLLNGYAKNNTSTINASLQVKQKFDFITKGLDLTALVNWKDYSSMSSTQRYDPFFYQVVDGSWSADKPDVYELQQVGSDGTDYIQQSGLTRWSDNTFYFDARLNYARRFGLHNVTGLLMYMMREYKNAALPNRNQGVSGRATYDYDNKYLAEFNFGYNGTERLAKGHRFEFFPAASLGWVISSEKFWEPIRSIISFMKIRGSYGLVGSDETGEDAGASHFLYRNSVSLRGSAYFITGENNEFEYNGPVINSYAVENACWERVKKMDLGIDINFFNDQLNVVFDFFHDKRDKILLKRGSWPRMMGYKDAIPWSNIGKVDNKGFELSVDWKKTVAKDLFLEVKGNFTYNKNKYEYVDEPNYAYVWQTKTGKPLSNTIGYIADGLFKDQADIDNSPVQKLGSAVMPGDIKYRDVNGDGQITAEDKVMISPYGTTPRIQYGFGFNVMYKKFDFGVFFNGSAKRTIMISGITPFCAVPGYPGYHGDRNVMQFIADDHWSLDNQNPNAKYPRLGIYNTQIDNNTEPSTFWQRNGDFMRFKTLEIGYSFPFVRVYFSGDNIALFSKFKEWDPELSWNSYPLSRTFNIGAQFKF